MVRYNIMSDRLREAMVESGTAEYTEEGEFVRLILPEVE